MPMPTVSDAAVNIVDPEVEGDVGILLCQQHLYRVLAPLRIVLRWQRILVDVSVEATGSLFDEAIREVARVLRPGGRFALFLNHPLLQTPNSGWIDDQILDPPEQYWRVGPYLVESVVNEEVCPGVVLPFVHRPLGRYVNALADAGLVVSRMFEPAPPAEFLARACEYGEAATIPRLLVLLCKRSSD